ncbi:hypothetical protein OQZ33_23645 [Pedobacter sp. MC2016-05]|uniref:hypothetical protein n=1 Tax=Pedobacter sp. MC2016-05 TaxID=2994474 RepID=UPI002245248D|nr:hypothetical protein [Pedobacter sp. MC2016-05]MCX2477349.1 hypothetical protein [Pedobacter sp. MC2016-05]
MKKFILYIVLINLSYLGFAQELTPPQVKDYVSGSTIQVSFPFGIKGVPFSQMPGSTWYPNSSIVAELLMTYYMEGDATKYTTKTFKFVNPSEKAGSWTITGLAVAPSLYSKPGKGMVYEKTSYLLSVYQSFGGKHSAMWYANINRSDVQIRKIPEEKLGLVVVHPKDKVILNPQPIPPRTIKKKRLVNP